MRRGCTVGPSVPQFPSLVGPAGPITVLVPLLTGPLSGLTYPRGLLSWGVASRPWADSCSLSCAPAPHASSTLPPGVLPPQPQPTGRLRLRAPVPLRIPSDPITAHPAPEPVSPTLGSLQRVPRSRPFSQPLPTTPQPHTGRVSPHPFPALWAQAALTPFPPVSPGFPAAVPPLPRERLGQDEDGAADEEAGRGGGGWPPETWGGFRTCRFWGGWWPGFRACPVLTGPPPAALEEDELQRHAPGHSGSAPGEAEGPEDAVHRAQRQRQEHERVSGAARGLTGWEGRCRWTASCPSSLCRNTITK